MVGLSPPDAPDPPLYSVKDASILHFACNPDIEFCMQFFIMHAELVKN